MPGRETRSRQHTEHQAKPDQQGDAGTPFRVSRIPKGGRGRREQRDPARNISG